MTPAQTDRPSPLERPQRPWEAPRLASLGSRAGPSPSSPVGFAANR